MHQVVRAEHLTTFGDAGQQTIQGILTDEQRSILASSDVDASVNDLQNPAGKFDRPIHRVQKGAEDDYHQSSEYINPIFWMKSWIVYLHVVFCLLPIEQAAGVQNAGADCTWSGQHLERATPASLYSLPMLDSLGAPTERCLSKIAHLQLRFR